MLPSGKGTNACGAFTNGSDSQQILPHFTFAQDLWECKDSNSNRLHLCTMCLTRSECWHSVAIIVIEKRGSAKGIIYSRILHSDVFGSSCWNLNPNVLDPKPGISGTAALPLCVWRKWWEWAESQVSVSRLMGKPRIQHGLSDQIFPSIPHSELKVQPKKAPELGISLTPARGTKLKERKYLSRSRTSVTIVHEMIIRIEKTPLTF